MTSITDTLKQALEALEIYWGKAEHRRTREDERQAESAITSLRQAIAELESQDDGYCQACDGALCTAKKGCVALSNPPQRKPLTDEQVEKIIKANMSLQMNLAGIRQDFEAAHGIKE